MIKAMTWIVIILVLGQLLFATSIPLHHAIMIAKASSLDSVKGVIQVAKAGDYALYEVKGANTSVLEKAARKVIETWSSKPITHLALYPTYPDPLLWDKASKLVGSSAKMSTYRKPIAVLPDTVLVWLPTSFDANSLADSSFSLPSSEEYKHSMIIVVGDESITNYAEAIKRIHEAHGMRIEIVSMDYIVSHYEPAKLPPYTLSEEYVEKYSVGKYNISKALSLISFLRKVVEERKAYYVLLLGNASTIPPFYYKSPILQSLISPEQGIVATDYWYMDPDYDMNPDLVVGRIPFTSPESLENYISALESWARGGSWQARALLVGGALFAWIMMLGETFVADASLPLSSKASISYLLLSTGNYTPSDMVSSIGSYGYYVIASHGSGRAFVDYVPGGLWGYQFEDKLRVDDIHKVPRPGVYASPACLTAWWDNEIIDPGFLPPSIGVALLSKGAGIAYVGPTRIAFEFIVDVKARSSGEYSIGYYGAMRLVELYSVWLTKADTLGEAYLKALASYLSLPYTMLEASTEYGSEKLGLLTALEFTFLGDPALRNTLAEEPEKHPPSPRILIRNARQIAFESIVTEFTAIAEGNAPLVVVKPSSNITVEFTPCPSAIKAIALYRYYSDLLIDLHEASLEIEKNSSKEACNISISLVDQSPGVYSILYWYGSRLGRLLVAVLGYDAWLDPSTGRLSVEVTGLDLLRVLGSEPVYILVNGRIASIIPGGVSSAKTSIDAGSFRGKITISIQPFYDYSLIVGGRKVFYSKLKLANMLQKEILLGYNVTRKLSLEIVGRGSKAFILVELGGRRVDANITAKTISGKEVDVERLVEGVYSLVGVKPGSLVLVEAEYRDNHTLAYGEAIYYAPPKPTYNMEACSIRGEETKTITEATTITITKEATIQASPTNSTRSPTSPTEAIERHEPQPLILQPLSIAIGMVVGLAAALPIVYRKK